MDLIERGLGRPGGRTAAARIGGRRGDASAPFRALFRRAAVEANRVFFMREQENALLDITDAAKLVRFALRSVSPKLAKEMPEDFEPDLPTLRRREFAGQTLAVADDVRVLGIVLPLLALALFAAAIAVAPRPARSAVLRSGVAVGPPVLCSRSCCWSCAPGPGRLDGRGRAHRRGSAGRRGAGCSTPLSGDLIAGGCCSRSPGWWSARPPPRSIPRTWRPARTAAAAGGQDREPVGARAARRRRAGARRAGGAQPGPRGAGAPSAWARCWSSSARASCLCCCSAAGPAAAASTPAAARSAWRDRRARGGRSAVAASSRSWWAPQRNETGAGGGAAPRRACNGSVSLCELPLNEAVCAGTHNSFSAADSPGWFITNQRHTIQRQLADGIRLFLIDPHWGVEGERGKRPHRLRRGGRATATVWPRRLPPKVRKAAQRIAGRLGAGGGQGGERGCCSATTSASWARHAWWTRCGRCASSSTPTAVRC